MRTIENFKKMESKNNENVRSEFEEKGFLVIPNLVDNLECSDIIKNACNSINKRILNHTVQ